jgi:taurine dioxygenase
MTVAQNIAQPTLDVRPIAGTIGAEIHGIDLSKPMSDDEFAAVHQVFLEYLVIFLPDQAAINPDRLKDFADRFGEIDMAPFAHLLKMPVIEGHPEILNLVTEATNRAVNNGGFWHSDVTYRERPNLGSVIYAKETLTDGMKEMLAPMRAIHSSAMPHGQENARFGAVAKDHAPSEADRTFAATGLEHTKVEVVETAHPVVRSHPDTGRKSLYVNRAFTSHFEGMTIEESLPLLEILWTHGARPEFTCRYRWSPDTIGVWDNRATLHYAINDYHGHRRYMQGISIHEPSRPV